MAVDFPIKVKPILSWSPVHHYLFNGKVREAQQFALENFVWPLSEGHAMSIIWNSNIFACTARAKVLITFHWSQVLVKVSPQSKTKCWIVIRTRQHFWGSLYICSTVTCLFALTYIYCRLMLSIFYSSLRVFNKSSCNFFRDLARVVIPFSLNLLFISSAVMSSIIRSPEVASPSGCTVQIFGHFALLSCIFVFQYSASCFLYSLETLSYSDKCSIRFPTRRISFGASHLLDLCKWILLQSSLSFSTPLKKKE